MSKRAFLFGDSGCHVAVGDPNARERRSASAGGSMLSGTIRSASGEALGGVPVSARPDGKTFTKTVFTDERGEYYFPPLEAPFAPGKYQVWAQAVGFERTTVDLEIGAAGAAKRELVLNTIQDFTNQLSGGEWLDALPADTHEDRRIKEIFRVNCVECHQPGLVLQNRFDEQGWLAIIEVMERATYHGWPGMASPPRNTITYHKQELAKYLAKIRGPESPRSSSSCVRGRPATPRGSSSPSSISPRRRRSRSWR